MEDKNHINLQNSIASTVFDIWQQTDKETQLKLSGHSMTPLIKNGDWLILKHNNNNIRVGSIIAYRRERKIVVHRVIKIQNNSDNNYFITKGDFNLHIDSAVEMKSVIGKVIAVKKNKQFFSIDTKFWNIVGYFIAINSFLFTKTYRIILYVKKRL
jgi:signal peptidase